MCEKNQEVKKGEPARLNLPCVHDVHVGVMHDVSPFDVKPLPVCHTYVINSTMFLPSFTSSQTQNNEGRQRHDNHIRMHQENAGCNRAQ